MDFVLGIKLFVVCCQLVHLSWASGQDRCQASQNITEMARWSQNLLQIQDQERLSTYWENNIQILDDKLLNLRNVFYERSVQTIESVCHVFKRIGGQWYDLCGFLDGEKLLCMDGLYHSIMNNDCLIYSFGLGKMSRMY